MSQARRTRHFTRSARRGEEEKIKHLQLPVHKEKQKRLLISLLKRKDVLELHPAGFGKILIYKF